MGVPTMPIDSIQEREYKQAKVTFGQLDGIAMFDPVVCILAKRVVLVRGPSHEKHEVFGHFFNLVHHNHHSARDDLDGRHYDYFDQIMQAQAICS
jgi:hypothetical protein